MSDPDIFTVPLGYYRNGSLQISPFLSNASSRNKTL